jgi:tripartite-type tricarboxylate transporter receptor subunit TctC
MASGEREFARRIAGKEALIMGSLRISAPLALVLTALSQPAPAQEFPTRAVTLVVPLAPGGAMDIITRAYGAKLSERLGKPVIVENRPGGGTVTAAVSVAKAAPDGHTLLVTPSGTLATNATLYKSLPYDPIKDFVPVALYTKVPFVLVVNPALPVKTLPELIKYAKDNPGRLTYASTGVGTVPHLAFEILKTMAGVEITHVPYRGTPPALNDVIGGHVHMFFSDTAVAPPLLAEGKIRALGVSSLTRAGVLPDVPTIAEAGLPGFEAVSWHLIVAPGATPRPIVEKLHAELRSVTTAPDIHQQMVTMGLIPLDTPSVDELQRFVASEIAGWGKVVRQVGIAGTE